MGAGRPAGDGGRGVLPASPTRSRPTTTQPQVHNADLRARHSRTSTRPTSGSTRRSRAGDLRWPCSRYGPARLVPHRRRRWSEAVRGLSFDVDARPDRSAIVGESGSGKSVSTQTIIGLTRGATVVRSTPSSTATTCSRADRRRAAPDPRGRDRDDLPGPAVQPAPALQVGLADRRDDPRARHSVIQAGGAHAGPSSCSTLVGIPHADGAGRRLPAPVLRRDAAAGDDRDGDGAQPGAADRRRADHRPRRHRAGAGLRRDARGCRRSSAPRSS